MSEGKPRPPRSVISRRVLLAAGGLVVLGEFIAGEGSGGANDSRTTASGSRAPRTHGAASPAGGGATPASHASHTSQAPGTPTSTPSDISSSSAAQASQTTATPQTSPGARAPAGTGKPPKPQFYINDGPKTIALTIDDGPDAVYTPQVLSLLQKYKVTATFSMIGRSVAADPGLAREVAAAGHKIVNHTWTHANLPRLTAAELTVQMDKANDVIQKATGRHLDMFRAPYGAWSAAVLARCQQLELTPLDWSVDPRDWARPGVDTIVSNIMKYTKTGSIILEHDGGGNRAETVAALTIAIPELLAAGYRFRTP